MAKLLFNTSKILFSLPLRFRVKTLTGKTISICCRKEPSTCKGQGLAPEPAVNFDHPEYPDKQYPKRHDQFNLSLARTTALIQRTAPSYVI
jgi:hypothetical protein